MSSESRVIVLTGAGRGLGWAMCQRLVDLGHVLWGCTYSASSLERLQQHFGEQHHFARVDVANDTEVASWAKYVIEQAGAPDLLINNAGLINENAPLWKVSYDEFTRVIDVNITGVFNTIRHFVPEMIQRKTGVIVNFSSGWGRSTSPEVAPYCATKYAIEGMTQAMAAELPTGVAAVALNPGVIHTDMLNSCFGADASAFPDPDDWAERAVPYILELGQSHNGRSLSVA